MDDSGGLIIPFLSVMDIADHRSVPLTGVEDNQRPCVPPFSSPCGRNIIL